MRKFFVLVAGSDVESAAMNIYLPSPASATISVLPASRSEWWNSKIWIGVFMMTRKNLLGKEANMYRSILKVGMIGVLFMVFLIPSVALAQGKELPGFRLFDTQEFIKVANPNKDKLYVTHIVTEKMGAKHLNALLLIIPPASTGAKVAYHYHKDRESILYIISGTGNEIVDDVKVPIKAGDVLFILPGVKHTCENTSDKEIRYVEFFTHPPVEADWVKVEK